VLVVVADTYVVVVGELLSHPEDVNDSRRML
jgi:predicted house-cleaning NTP pyrophosphatase (Maf/HAM1 superfamily)